MLLHLSRVAPLAHQIKYVFVMEKKCLPHFTVTLDTTEQMLRHALDVKKATIVYLQGSLDTLVQLVNTLALDMLRAGLVLLAIDVQPRNLQI